MTTSAQSQNSSSPIVGIDLGTTNSLVAFCDERGPRVLAAGGVGPMVPSVVRLAADGTGNLQAVVGVEAREQASAHAASTVSSIKRLMGRSARDAAADAPFLPFRVVEGDHATARALVRIDGQDRAISPQEISAFILRELKSLAERAMGVPIRRAVVTVPAYFDDAQRQATRDAGRLAGLEIVRIINEPTAAALAYGLGLHEVLKPAEPAPMPPGGSVSLLKGCHSTSAEPPKRSPATGGTERLVGVYDLGGGTFDVSILRLTPGASSDETSFFEVLSTSGDTHLGGDDADQALMSLVMQDQPAGTLSDADRRSLRSACERLKRELSERDEGTLALDLESGASVRRRVLRSEYEAAIEPLVARTIERCRLALADAATRLGLNDGAAVLARLDAVVLVGGMTRTPLVRARVRECFGLEPYTALNPDEVVALGASVQAAILDGRLKGTLLLDVIPLSLGIETVGGAVSKLIVRNSSVPARAREMFSTSVDNQTSIRLRVLQGEREMAEDCRELGVFHLRGIPPMPAGIPQVEVEFFIDAGGVLRVAAHERRSGKRAQIQIVPNHGLTREEVDRIERESFLHARTDMNRHRVVDLMVNSKLDLKWIGERLDRYKDLLEPAYRDSLAARLDALRNFVAQAEARWDAVDPNAFHQAKEALDRESVRLQEIGIAESLRAEGRRVVDPPQTGGRSGAGPTV